MAGMSGGGVFTSDNHLFATNDFSDTPAGCSADGCYNGEAARDKPAVLTLFVPQHCQGTAAHAVASATSCRPHTPPLWPQDTLP